MTNRTTGSSVASDDHLQQVIETGRATLEQEIQRAERLELKARGQVTLAGTWFAIVQAVAGTSLDDARRGWIIALAGTAVAGALFFGLLLRGSYRVWSLRTRDAMSEETLGGMERAAHEDPSAFLGKMVEIYRHILNGVQDTNHARAEALSAATLWWWLTLGAGFVELLSTMLSRLNVG